MRCQHIETQGFKLLEWPKLRPSPEGLIFWHIVNFPYMMEKTRAIDAFRDVFAQWQIAMDAIHPAGRVITYDSTSEFKKAHIRLLFVNPGLQHEAIDCEDRVRRVFNIPSKMDGSGGVLAYVPHGDHTVFFDHGENWGEMGMDKTGTISLFGVALHEVGHLHDLGHSKVDGAVMQPYYSPQITEIQEDDILGLSAGFSPMKIAIKYGSYTL